MRLLNLLKEKVPFIGIAVLLIFIPLYPKFPMFEVPKTYVAIRFEDFLVAFLLGFFLLRIVLERKNFLKDRLSRLIMVYFLIGGLSVLSAVFVTGNVIPHIAVLHWFRRIEYMSLFFVAAISVRKLQDVKDYLFCIFLATIGVIVYGLGQKFLGFPVISTMNEEFSKGLLLSLTEWSRVSSTFAGHYDLAAYLVLVLSLTVGGVVAFRHVWHKIIILIFGLVTLYLLVLTSSQISFAAYVLSSIAVLIFSKKYLWIIPLLAISVLGLFASQELSQRYSATIKMNYKMMVENYQKSIEERRLAALVRKITPTPTSTPTLTPAPAKPGPAQPVKSKKVILPTITPTPTSLPGPEPFRGTKRYVQYGREEGEPTDIVELTAYRSVKIRLNIEWPRSLRGFLKNPLLGSGYSSLTLATDNDYLRSLGETGLLGFFALFLIILELTRRFLMFLRDSEKGFARVIVISLFGALIGILINAGFIDVLESSKVAFVFWILMGIMVGIMNLPGQRKAQNE